MYLFKKLTPINCKTIYLLSVHSKIFNSKLSFNIENTNYLSVQANGL